MMRCISNSRNIQSPDLDVQSHSEMVRMKSKAAWIFFPCLANRPEWCLLPERLQVFTEVVALYEGLDMLP